MYLEAETLSGRTYCESCLACLTAYLSYICIDTHYEKVGIIFLKDFWEIFKEDHSGNLLHSEQPKLHRVLAVLSAVGLKYLLHP